MSDTCHRIMRLDARIAELKHRHDETCRQLWAHERWSDPTAASGLLLATAFDIVTLELTRENLIAALPQDTVPESGT